MDLLQLWKLRWLSAKDIFIEFVVARGWSLISETHLLLRFGLESEINDYYG